MSEQLLDRLRDRLPDDRQIVPEEIEPVAEDVGAQGVTSVRYSDDSGFEAVSILILWWEDEQIAIMADRHGGGWELDAMEDVDLNDFQRAVEVVSQRFEDTERRGPDRLVLDDGRVRELRDPDNEEDQQ